MNKKAIMLLFTIVLIANVVIAVLKVNNEENEIEGSEEKIKIIATLFPQYDFARVVGGDKVDVQLLLPSGVESHSYEPTPKDMIKINEANIFAYTGEQMEPWAEVIASSIDSDTLILNTTKNVEFIKEEGHEHSDEEETNHSEEENHSHETEEHEYDPHIWLDPQNAIVMVENIKNALIEVDQENKEYYEENANKYIENLKNLDKNIEKAIEEGKINKIAFGGPFSYSYFIKRYDIEYISAYESCSGEAEPSVSKVKLVIEEIKKDKLPIVFYESLSSGNIAKTISEETGTTILDFHTVHNVSEEQIGNGATYISLMEQNLKNLKKALN